MNVGVGMPAWLKLNLFGQLVRDAYGVTPYLVGSAATSKRWRDVDVRVMLTPEQYERIVGEGHRSEAGGLPQEVEPNYFDACQEDALCGGHPAGRRRTAITLAWCALGREMTGLPVDFQFQVYDPGEPLSKEEGVRVVLGGAVALKVPGV